jgi:drug/metabolite transporter (DMT)-like permease
MTGEILALLAALAYGFAGVSITQGKAAAQGDNGVFLSVILTFVLSLGLWIGWGNALPPELALGDALSALCTFALAGGLANVVGRKSMYRATEMVGAVRAGLLRRLTPVFALPCAIVLLGQSPDSATLLGSAIVLCGVVVYLGLPSKGEKKVPNLGVVAGALSALAYALAYCFRGIGLVTIPDAALGACVGSLFAALFMLFGMFASKGIKAGWAYLTIDKTPQHWQTALALSAGQMLQFFALETASVLSVAVLGTLEVLFSAAIILLITRRETIAVIRLVFASLITMGGTALLFIPA